MLIVPMKILQMIIMLICTIYQENNSWQTVNFVYDDINDVRVIDDTDRLAKIDGDEPSCSNPVTSLNNWKEVSAEGGAQKELREKMENFEPQENIILQELDDENSTWAYLHTFELFFDGKLIELIVEMTNQYALEKGPVAWTLADEETIRSFIAILTLSRYVQLPSYRMFWEEAPYVQH